MLVAHTQSSRCGRRYQTVVSFVLNDDRRCLSQRFVYTSMPPPLLQQMLQKYLPQWLRWDAARSKCGGDAS